MKIENAATPNLDLSQESFGNRMSRPESVSLLRGFGERVLAGLAAPVRGIALAGALTAPLVLTGCAKEEAKQDHIQAFGKAVSFDMMDSRINSIDNLRKATNDFEKSHKTVNDGLTKDGPGWVDSHQKEMDVYRQSLTTLHEQARVARQDEAFEPLREKLIELDGLVWKLIQKSSNARVKSDWELGPDQVDTFRTDAARVATTASDIHHDTALAQMVLPKIALRALLHEHAHVVNEFMTGVKDEGRKWFENQDRHAALLERLARVSEVLERYVTRPDLEGHQDKLLGLRTRVVDARTLIADPNRFPEKGDDVNFTEPPLKQISDLSDQLVETKDFLKEMVDLHDTEIQKQGVAAIDKRPERHSSGSGGHFFLLYMWHSSATSNPAAFSGGRGGFGAPTAPVSRGGFGSIGARGSAGG